MTTRRVVFAVLVLLIGIGGPVAAAGAAAANATGQLTDPEYLDDAGRIIGSPDAGPKPQHSGDRGGWAQFATLGVMVAGVSFIGWRISRQVSSRAT